MWHGNMYLMAANPNIDVAQLWSNFGTKKRRAVLSNYSAYVYEA